MFSQLLSGVPTVVAAIGIFILGWILASVMGNVTQKLFEKLSVSGWFAKWRKADAECNLPKHAGSFVYYLIMLMTFLAFCERLGLTVFFEPINRMLNIAFGYLPQLAGAIVLAVVALVAAKILRMLVAGLLTSLDADRRLGEYVKIPVTQSLADVTYGLTLLLFLPMVLDALGLRSLLEPINLMFNKVFAFIPNLISALIILAVFYIGASILAKLTSNALAGIGFDALAAKCGCVKGMGEGRKPSDIAGYLVMFAVMLLGLTEATQALGLALLSALVVQFTLFCSKLLLGVIIMAAGAWLARWSYKTILATESAQSHFLATVARAAIWIFAGSMALREIGLANDIINLAFGLLLGAIAIAIAVAFGLGGREIAARELEQWISALKKKE